MTADGAAEHSTGDVLPSGVPSGAPGPLPGGVDFDQLYRDHVDDARRLATILVGTEQAEELVAESFARVLAQLRAGRGPRDNFRAYLHVTIRNGFRDSLRGPREAPVSDQPWLFDDAQPPTDELVEDLEADTAAHAFATLPESWQKVLWHVEVEGRKPGEVADLLGMRAGAVSSLAHRAREGLRRAYLDQHVVAETAASDCAWTRARLSQYVRSDLSARAEEKVAAHIGACEECLAAYLQVDRVNRKLAAWIFPVVLLGALPASGKGLAWLVGITGLAGASGSGGAGGGGSSSSSTTTIAVAAAAAVAAVAAGVTMVVAGGDDTAPASAGADPSTPPAVAGVGEAEDPPADPAPRRDRVVPAADDPAPVEAAVPSEAPTEPATTPRPRRRPAAAPVVVEAVAPTARPVGSCDTTGSLTLPTTRGVRYERTVGDGLSGAWRVEATARPGYVLRSGSRRTFAGDLGEATSCVALASVASTEDAHPVWGHWDVASAVTVDDSDPHALTLTFDFDQDAVLVQKDAASVGWTCLTSGGLPIGLQLGIGLGDALTGPVVCAFDYTGVAPPPLTLHAAAMDGLQRTAPTGTVTLHADGESVDGRPF